MALAFALPLGDILSSCPLQLGKAGGRAEEGEPLGQPEVLSFHGDWGTSLKESVSGQLPCMETT